MEEGRKVARERAGAVPNRKPGPGERPVGGERERGGKEGRSDTTRAHDRERAPPRARARAGERDSRSHARHRSRKLLRVRLAALVAAPDRHRLTEQGLPLSLSLSRSAALCAPIIGTVCSFSGKRGYLLKLCVWKDVKDDDDGGEGEGRAHAG